MIKNVAIFLLVITVFSCSRSSTIKSLFPGLIMDPLFEKKEIVVDKEFQESNIWGKKIAFTGDNKEAHMIIEVMTEIDQDKATSLFKNKALMIKGLYSIQATPYSGAITKEASCMVDLQIDPAALDTKLQTSMVFTLKATERLVLGVCLEEQNVYHNQTLLLYCKNDRTFYDLRYYYPKKDHVLKGPLARCAH